MAPRHRRSHVDPRRPLHLQLPQCLRQPELPGMIPVRKTPGRTGSLASTGDAHAKPGLRKCGAPAPVASTAEGGVTYAHVESRRRCPFCRVPSNQCPCRTCGACSTAAGAPGPICGCGRGRRKPLDSATIEDLEREYAEARELEALKDDRAGEGERSPREGSPASLIPEGAE